MQKTTEVGVKRAAQSGAAGNRKCDLRNPRSRALSTPIIVAPNGYCEQGSDGQGEYTVIVIAYLRLISRNGQPSALRSIIAGSTAGAVEIGKDLECVTS